MKAATVGLDRRRERSARTQSDIIDAWVSVVEFGDLSPTGGQVAQQAGIGLRTVFEHFGSMRCLATSAVSREFGRFTSDTVGPVSPADSVQRRAGTLVSTRAVLYEDLTMVRRAAEVAELDDVISTFEAVCAREATDLFAAELPGTGTRDGDAAREAVAVVSSWAHWNQLRYRRRQSIAVATAITVSALAAIVG